MNVMTTHRAGGGGAHGARLVFNPALQHMLTARIQLANNGTVHVTEFVKAQISGHSVSALLIPLNSLSS